MKIGQLVTLPNNETCFVEDILGQMGSGPKKGNTRISVYKSDGDYKGDWWTDEIDVTDELVTPKTLIDLIVKNKTKIGIVRDFAKVLTHV